jgi:hypothetical protein
MSARAELARRFRAVIMETIERRPIAELPEEGTLTLVDNGTLGRLGDRRAEARFRNGRWMRPGGGALPFTPMFWVRWRDD